MEGFKNHKELWDDIVEKHAKNVNDVEEYLKAKNPPDPPPFPIIEYLEETTFPVLNAGLVALLMKVRGREGSTIMEGEDVVFNPLAFLAEYIWNTNPRHPHRRENWIHFY